MLPAETAARDRLGKGQKIEIKPMSSIVDKLRERRALAIARAPKARPLGAVDFDDVMAAAATELADAEQPAAPAADAAAPAPAAEDDSWQAEAGPAEAAATPRSQDEDGGSAGGAADLDIVSEDEDAGGAAAARVVELPSTVKRPPKPSPLAYLPLTQSREMDDFEDEVLIEDGAGSDAESDGDSERSWEVRPEGEAAAAAAAGETGEEAAGDGGSDEEDSAGSQEAEGEEEEDDEDEEMAQEEGEEDASGVERARVESAVASQEQQPAAALSPGRAKAAAAAAASLGATPGVPKHARRLQRVFLDMEAELRCDLHPSRPWQQPGTPPCMRSGCC